MGNPRDHKDEAPLREKQNYFAVGQMFSYFVNVFTRKEKSGNINLKVMHGINKISILMFLVALIVWTIKRLM